MKSLGGFPDSLLLGPESGGAARLMDTGTPGCGWWGSSVQEETLQPREWRGERLGEPDPPGPHQPSQGFGCLSWSNGEVIESNVGRVQCDKARFLF